jgi:Kdo2-lipid IVA lauroyltransferase/acyltransferase
MFKIFNNFIFTYIFIGILHLCAYLPNLYIMRIAYAIGAILYKIPSKRKAIIQNNIQRCFKAYNAQQQDTLVKNTFYEVMRSILERGKVWFGSKKSICQSVNIHGLENIPANGAILLGIHLSGLEMTGLALSIVHKQQGMWASVYMPQRNQLFDAILKKQRMRFGVTLFNKTDGVKNILRYLKQGGYVQIFTDMDFGLKDSILSPFFGEPAATITSIPRLAALSGKFVVPMVPIFNRATGIYDLYILPAFANFPSSDIQKDVDRLNIHFEQAILRDPSQYWWVHRRFKSVERMQNQ